MKTASTSIEIALSKICGADDLLTPLTPIEDEEKRYIYARRSAQNYFIPIRKSSQRDFFKLIRYGQRPQYYHHMSASQLKKYISSDIWNDYYKFCFERNPWDKLISWYYWLLSQGEDYKSISEFLSSGRGTDLKGFELYTEGGIQIVDNVGRYENMKRELEDISERLNLSETIRLPIPWAKGSNRIDKRHYREILSEEEAQFIRTIFAREIQFMGYEY